MVAAISIRFDLTSLAQIYLKDGAVEDGTDRSRVAQQLAPLFDRAI